MSIISVIKDLSRLREIVSVFFDEGFHLAIQKSQLHGHVPFTSKLMKKKADESELPRRFVNALEKLGPTFVKMGQMLSNRPDLLPEEYAFELKKLQDQVKSMPFHDVQEILERELKKPMSEVFEYFEQEPIGSASIAQVHRAKLKATKKIVAVKIQRKGIKEIMFQDIEIMRYIASQIHNHYPPARVYGPVSIVDEFAHWTEKELDFRIEAESAEVMRSNLKKFKDLKIPEIYWDYTTERLLVMEFIEGKKLSEVLSERKKFDMKKISNIGAKAVMKMVFEDGFFHADPHPGNFLVTKGNKLAMLDFGIIGRFNHEDKKIVSNILIALNSDNADMLSYQVMKISKCQNVDISNFKRDLEEFIIHWKVGRISLGESIYKIISISSKNGVRAPKRMVIFGKCIITLEHTMKQLNPDFEIIKYLKPYSRKSILLDFSVSNMKKKIKSAYFRYANILEDMPKKASNIINRFENEKVFDSESLTDLEREMHKSSALLSNAVVVAGLLISSALMMQLKIPPLFYDMSILSLILFTAALIILFTSFIKNRFVGTHTSR